MRQRLTNDAGKYSAALSDLAHHHSSKIPELPLKVNFQRVDIIVNNAYYSICKSSSLLRCKVGSIIAVSLSSSDPFQAIT